MRRTDLPLAVAAILALIVSSAGAAERQLPAGPLMDLKSVTSPTPAGSAEPHLAVSPDGVVWMSWLERRPKGGHALRGARLAGARWTSPFTIAQGDSFFANWADFPTLLPRGGDHLVAHYLWKSGAGTYAYDVRLTRSKDGGRTWSAPRVPHRDGTPTEHGFVSLMPALGGTRAVWLDGRQSVRDSAGHMLPVPEGSAEMTLRTTVLADDGTLTDERELDGRVCDCCQTAAVAIPGGALVAYRDRTADEIRDIQLTRMEGGRWSKPYPLHVDGWKIAGCPVNGPALAASGDRVAVAWFTGANDTSRVRVAFSDDRGAHFGAPVEVDEGAPLGRVHILLLEGGDALVGWLESRGKEALFQVRRVAGDGTTGSVMTVARTSTARSSGFPRLARSGNQVVLAWTEGGKPSHVRTAIARVAPAGASRSGAAAASHARLLAKVREHRLRHQGAILREFADLLRIPNLASDSLNIRRNADLLVTMLERRGLSARRLELPGSPPAVYGELRAPGARRTVVLYAHYDGQPVAKADWASDPWKPVLCDRPLDQGGREVPWPAKGGTFDPEWRLYARSAGDDKAPIVALLAALDGLAADRARPSVNLKVFLEGEEEAGSPNLRSMLERHRKTLAADAWIFCDGPMHPSRRPQLVFGVRGVMGLELTVYGPRRALHSGHYGNWAPNPIARMNDLLASLRDGDGRILVTGLERNVRPVSEAERAALRATPDPDDALRGDLQLGSTEDGGARLSERIMRPAINFRGVRAGGVGESSVNAIPTEARASIDFRLVPDQTPAGVRSAIEAHLRAKGWHIVTAAPDSATRRAHDRIVRLQWDDGYGPYRVPLDGAFPSAVAQVMEQSLGRPVLLTPTLGGSLPVAVIGNVLGVPVIVLPIANHDNNQHAANENLRLQNLWDGIDVMAGLLILLGDRWR